MSHRIQFFFELFRKANSKNFQKFLRITSTLCRSYASKRKSQFNQRLSTFSSCFNPPSIAGLTCTLKFQNSIHTRMRLCRNLLRGLSTRSRNAPLPPPTPNKTPHQSLYLKFELTKEKTSRGFIQWHWDAERYLGPQDCRSEVKNALIKLSPLELGSPQMPLDIRNGYDFNIEF